MTNSCASGLPTNLYECTCIVCSPLCICSLQLLQRRGCDTVLARFSQWEALGDAASDQRTCIRFVSCLLRLRSLMFIGQRAATCLFAVREVDPVDDNVRRMRDSFCFHLCCCCYLSMLFVILLVHTLCGFVCTNSQLASRAWATKQPYTIAI